jgi:endonuclease/exonuclease/phosphatase family metal-dependent hydrolase
VQVAQANELLAIVEQSPLPVVMAGDFNSAANASAPASTKTAKYGTLLSAAFRTRGRMRIRPVRGSPAATMHRW